MLAVTIGMACSSSRWTTLALASSLSLACTSKNTATDDAGTTGDAGATEGTQPETGTADEGDTETEPTTGGDCGSECEPTYECIANLASDGGLLATSNSLVRIGDEECDELCEALRFTILRVDPATDAREELAVGGVGARADAMIADSEGNIIVAGEWENTTELEGTGRALLQKYTPAGELSWGDDAQAMPEGPFRDVAMVGDEIVAVGWSIAGYGPDGSLAWDLTEQLPEGADAIEVDEEGNFYLVSTTLAGGVLRKLDATRAVLWEAPLPSEGANLVISEGLALDGDGGIAVGYGLRDAENEWTVTIAAFDGDGAPKWSVEVDGGSGDNAIDDGLRALISRPGGGVVAAGHLAGKDGLALTLELDAEGNEVGRELFDLPEAVYEDNSSAIVLDGQLWVSGCAHDEPGTQVFGWLRQPVTG